MDIPYPEIGAVDHSSKEHPLGSFSVTRDDDELVWKAYMYVKVVDLDVADGDALDFAQIFDDNTDFVPHVTADRSGGSSLGQIPAGVAVNSITSGNFGWIQTRGLHSSTQTESGAGTDLAVGNQVTTDQSNDGSIAQVSAHGDVRLGTVIAAATTDDTSAEIAIDAGLSLPIDT